MEVGAWHQVALETGRPGDLSKERGLAGISPARPSIKTTTFSHMERQVDRSKP